MWALLASAIDITHGCGKRMRRARRMEPRAHAVSDVKEGKMRELSIAVMAAGSVGGSRSGIIGSAAMIIDNVSLKTVGVVQCVRNGEG